MDKGLAGIITIVSLLCGVFCYGLSLTSEEKTGTITDKWEEPHDKLFSGGVYYYFEIDDDFYIRVDTYDYRTNEIGDEFTFRQKQIEGGDWK